VDRVATYDSTGTHRGLAGGGLSRGLCGRMASTGGAVPQLFRRRAGSVAGGDSFSRRVSHRRPALPAHASGDAGGSGRGTAPGVPVPPSRAGAWRRRDGLPRLAVRADAVRAADELLARHGVEPGERWDRGQPGVGPTEAPSAGPPSGSPRPRMRWRCGAKPRSSSSDRAGKWPSAVGRAEHARAAVVLGGTDDIGMLPGLLRRSPLAADNDTGCHARRRGSRDAGAGDLGPTDVEATGRGARGAERADAGAVQPVPRA